MKDISIIIPCYNVEKYLSECLESIMNQSIGLDVLEIILVDDASTDRTSEIIMKYEKEYPEHIKAILCDENGRQGRARNIGLQYAEGKYISFVDSDDWIHKDMYQILYNIAETEEADIIQFRQKYCVEKEKDKVIGEILYQMYDYSGMKYDYNAIISDVVLTTGCLPKFYTRRLIDTAGVRFPEQVMYEEPFFTFPLKFYAKKICVLEEKLYYYRYNPNGTVHHDMENFSTITDHLKVQLELHNELKRKAFYQEYKDEIDFYFIHSFAIEPFLFAKARNWIVMFPVYRFISTTLVRELPCYKENKYVQSINDQKELKYYALIKRYYDGMTDNDYYSQIYSN